MARLVNDPQILSFDSEGAIEKFCSHPCVSYFSGKVTSSINFLLALPVFFFIQMILAMISHVPLHE